LAQQREQPWAEVMAQLRERAERLASEAPFLAPPGGQDGRPARRAAGYDPAAPRPFLSPRGRAGDQGAMMADCAQR
jgi:hypothetical protein